MVITISEMVNSVLNSSHDALPGHEEQGKAVSNKIILTVSISALLIALFLREYFLQVFFVQSNHYILCLIVF